jgi:hypothetical protein
MSPEQHPSEIDSIQASAQEEAFQAHPEHAAAVNAAFDAIHQLINEQPEFADFLRLSTSTEDVRQALHNHGIEITNEALWRHRGSLLKDGQPTWRG